MRTGTAISAGGKCKITVGGQMKPLPATPHVPGNTDAERMNNALRAVLTVSKIDLLKREAQQKRKRERKQTKQAS